MACNRPFRQQPRPLRTLIGLVLTGWIMHIGGDILAAPRSAAEPRPNFIVILADDLGYGDLGCYGNERHRTQRLDRMAREGVRFTQFYVPTPYCAPSRASLLTGRYPWKAGVWQNPWPGRKTDHLGIPD